MLSVTPKNIVPLTKYQIYQQWQDAFLSLHNGFVNIRNVNIEPLHTVAFSGLVRKAREVVKAVKELRKYLKQNRCVRPWVVALDRTGQINVCVFNMSAKAISVSLHTTL